jgi:hypothetical protein
VASVVVSLVFALRSAARSRAAQHLEILALRHQLAVLNRSRPSRLRLTAADRMLWAWLSQAWSAWRPALVLVKPETVLTWHRRGFRLFWTWKSRNRTGRPAMAPEVRALIRRMATANPLWGAPRIHGELLKLGISVSQATVAKYMPRRDSPPSQPWRTFLATHVDQIMAADFSVVPTVTYQLLFVLVILAHDRRRIVHVAVTDHPTAAWTARQLRKRLSRGPRPAVPPARPRCRVHERRLYHRRNADPRGRHSAAIAVAERLRRAPHWLDPTGVPRSHDHPQYRRTPARPRGLRRVLHAHEDAPESRQGRTGVTTRHAALCRTHGRDSTGSRPASPLRPHRGVATVPQGLVVSVLVRQLTAGLRVFRDRPRCSALE